MNQCKIGDRIRYHYGPSPADATDQHSDDMFQDPETAFRTAVAILKTWKTNPCCDDASDPTGAEVDQAIWQLEHELESMM